MSEPSTTTSTGPTTDHHDEPLPEGVEAPPSGVRAMGLLRWSLVALMLGVAALSSAYYLGAFERQAVASSQRYSCPMHPAVIQDHPGSCPICHMDLVEVAPVSPEVAAPGDAGAAPVPGLTTVELSPERIQLMGMRTATVSEEVLSSRLDTVGFVAPIEKGLALVHARFSGWIERLPASETGMRVKRGQVLASIYSPELLPPQQELLAALRWDASGAAAPPRTGHMTAGLAEAARGRLRILGLSEATIKTIERTGEPVRTVDVIAPAAGTITRRGAALGLYVQPGTELYQLADLSRVWVMADIYEYELDRVHVGQSATVSFPSYPGEVFPAKVSFLYPTLDPDTRTMRARLEVDNKDGRLRPGLYGEVHLTAPGASALVIPVDALVDTGEHQYVFVALDGGRFEPRLVEVGARQGDKVAVRRGVSAGETVVTTANFLIDSESRLRAAIQGFGSAGGAGAAGPAAAQSVCERSIDKQKFPDKYQQCRACDVHRGMGSMEADCRDAIPRPWK
ncbi:MAG: efflux RND transporter periplasmic adaptor subunit [Deltaproteobacteria bacterium]|nr:efflux RND transporter periplasmic adaptor subunit [Deltaproteobacteria bacterium]